MGESNSDDKANAQQQKIKSPRLYHKKSRTGCQRCRARRVKCDEAQPVCGSCTRHEVACIYANPPPVSRRSTQKSTPSTPDAEKSDLLQRFSLTFPEDEDSELGLFVSGSSPEEYEQNPFDIIESKVRRKLELRLLGNFIEHTSQTLSACQNPEVRHAWSVNVPRLSLEHDNLLYEMFAISALHLLKSEPGNSDLIVARQAYLGLALREHRRAIAQLHSENADAVCFTSSLMLIDSFASLQDRLLEPYIPPMEWLKMAGGAGSVFTIAMNTLDDFDASAVQALVRSKPHLNDGDALFSPRNRERLVALLHHERQGEIWDLETQQAYEQALSYIGAIQLAIENGEHILGVARLINAFALMVPRRFVDLVEEYRPRALVLLAYYFSLASPMKDIWWIGNIAQREVEAIANVLPPQWMPAMVQPLAAVRFQM